VATTTTPTPGKRSATAEARKWLRAIHRDVGYIAVGLTFIYALSGIAVNHITDWSDGDPSFKTYSTTHQLDGIKTSDDVLARLAIKQKPKEIYQSTPDEIEILFDKPQRTLHVNTQTGVVVDEGQSPRFILRVANWLHLNRGKKAWTYVADAYAGGLLFLALSGMFMIAGKKGLLGRGAILVGLGIAVPVLYVTFAGP
jgi:uncharacterized protein